MDVLSFKLKLLAKHTSCFSPPEAACSVLLDPFHERKMSFSRLITVLGGVAPTMFQAPCSSTEVINILDLTER